MIQSEKYKKKNSCCSLIGLARLARLAMSTKILSKENKKRKKRNGTHIEGEGETRARSQNRETKSIQGLVQIVRSNLMRVRYGKMFVVVRYIIIH